MLSPQQFMLKLYNNSTGLTTAKQQKHVSATEQVGSVLAKTIL